MSGITNDYLSVELKCNLCDHRDTLELTLGEYITAQSSGRVFTGAGTQCEFFYEHLAQVHNIHDFPVGLCSISSCLFGVDEVVTDAENLHPAYGGIDLHEYFTRV